MHGTSAVDNQASARYLQASAQRTQAVKDMPHDGDADDQKVANQASAQRTQPLPQQKQAGVGGKVDIVV